MKIRQGFVSNSSSSSFVAVITDDQKIIDKFLEEHCSSSDAMEDFKEGSHEDFEDINYGIYEHGPTGLHVYSSWSDINWIGLQIEDLLKKDMKLSECKQVVINMFAAAGIKVKPSQLRLECGECSSE